MTPTHLSESNVAASASEPCLRAIMRSFEFSNVTPHAPVSLAVRRRGPAVPPRRRAVPQKS